MTDPIKKLREDVLSHLIPGSANVVEERMGEEFDAFEREWKAREVRHDPSGPECYWTDKSCDGEPTTILVPRAKPGLLEAAEALLRACEKPQPLGAAEVVAAMDAVRAALTKEER